MPKIFTSKSQKTGELGEGIAVRYLENKGFEILERNHTKKWGEIDIVGRKDNRIHFVEVKSKTVMDFIEMKKNEYSPVENIHYQKQKRLRRTIQTYLLQNRIEGEWQFDIALVYIKMDERIARVEILDDIIL